MSLETQALRRACSMFATGVAIVTTRLGEIRVGLTVNSFSSVSLNPPLVSWSLRENAKCRPIFEQAGAFAVNILSAGQLPLARHFATGAPDLLASCETFSSARGLPLIAGALAHLECVTRQIQAIGDHHLLVGEVTGIGTRAGAPLLFFNGHLSGGALDTEWGATG